MSVGADKGYGTPATPQASGGTSSSRSRSAPTKDIGGLRKLRHRGEAKAAAYNLVRLRNLLVEPSQG